MRRTFVLCVLTALPFTACVSALPGGSLDPQDSGSAGSAGQATGGAAGSTGMGGTRPGVGGNDTGLAASSGSGRAGIGGSASAGRASGPGIGGVPGCAPAGLLLASNGRARNIAVDAASVFWVQHTAPSPTLVKAPVSGGDPVVLASVQGMDNWVAVDTTGVYWSDAASANGTTILKVGFDGGTPTTVVASDDHIARFAVGADGVYWTGPRGVMKATFDLGTPTVLAPAVDAGEVVVDAANVYWIAVDTGSIMKLAGAGGTDPIVLAQGQSGPTNLALDGQQYVYWVSQGSGAVMRVLVDGSGQPESPFPPSTVKTCTGVNGPARAVAVDATGVYWIDAIGNLYAGLPGQPMNARLLAANGPTPAFGIVLDATSVYWMTPSSILWIPK
jgi:hypothetical protein